MNPSVRSEWICIYKFYSYVCMPDRYEFIDHRFGSRLSCWQSLYELPKKRVKIHQRRRLRLLLLPDDLLKIPFKICLLTAQNETADTHTPRHPHTRRHTHTHTRRIVRSTVKKIKIENVFMSGKAAKQNKTQKKQREMMNKMKRDQQQSSQATKSVLSAALHKKQLHERTENKKID